MSLFPKRLVAIPFAFVSAFALGCSVAHDTSASPDAGPNATGTTADGGVAHPSGEGDPVVDSGKTPPIDAGEVLSGCTPGNVTGFTPNWIPPTTLHQGVCTGAQVTTLVDCLFNASADQKTCDAFVNSPDTLNCQTCAVTGVNDTNLGPLLISLDDVVTLNLAGCIARTSNDITAAGCGAKVSASRQCAIAACEANCPVPSGNAKALADRTKCMSNAVSSTGVCSTYQKDGETCSLPLLQGPSAPCAAGNTYEEIAVNLVTLFCAN